jgi:hypothetical protein
MTKATARSQRSWPRRESDTTSNDRTWNELLEACEARFPALTYEVSCDARHTVWVRRSDGTRSVGLSPWLLREHSLDEVLAGVDAKLDAPVAVHASDA